MAASCGFYFSFEKAKRVHSLLKQILGHTPLSAVLTGACYNFTGNGEGRDLLQVES